MTQSGRSYCITVRPGDGCNGLNKSIRNKIITWCENQDFAFLVEEKEGHEAHLHLQSWHREPMLRNTIGKAFQRFMKASYAEGTYQVQYAIKIKHGYNDWWDHYLLENPSKVDECKVLYETLPQTTEEYYPTEEE